MSRVPALLLAPIVLRQAARLRASVPQLPEARGAHDGLVGARGRAGAGAGADAAVGVGSGVGAGVGHPLRVLVVGDSTAVGTGVTTLDDAIPGRLARLLSDRGAVAWRAVGRSGATAREVLEGFADAAVAAHFDLGVVLVGWNDAMRLRPASEFARALGALLDRLHAGSPEARLIVVAPPGFGRFAALPNPVRWVLGRHANGLTRRAGRVAREHGAATASGFDGRSVASDGFHPDAAGYQALAEGIVAAFRARP
ncbi:SGNH/GDSL hydrolase family protein [Lysinimonas soli]|uniref:SGNH/GDSL hydrolase family protein n=1 Tax=Lysinimonas soli TaxID=1074233 RepID=A0ABW0NP08_9MICO